MDCDDWDCDEDPACEGFGEICDNGQDDDADGYMDCEDFDCDDDPACEGAGEFDCADGIDNDENGFTDCDDFDCGNDPICEGEGPVEGNEICDNGQDDDGDMFVDCEDADCVAAEVCVEDPNGNEGPGGSGMDDGTSETSCAMGSAAQPAALIPLFFGLLALVTLRRRALNRS